MSAAHELPVLVTVDEAAESLSLHPDQVRRLVRRGELVGYRLGRAVRVEVDSVRAYLARCRLHVPQPVPAPTSEDRTSTDAARPGTPAGARRSRRAAVRIARQIRAPSRDHSAAPLDPGGRGP